MLKVNFSITFTNTIGCIALFLSIHKGVDAGIYAASALILGRSTAKYFGKHPEVNKDV